MKMISNDLRSSCRALLLGAYQEGGDTPTKEKWQYPSDWLPLPEVGENEAAFLIVISEEGGRIVVHTNGNYCERIEWGDGSVYPDNSSVAGIHYYVFGNGTPLTDKLEMYILKLRCPVGTKFQYLECDGELYVFACCADGGFLDTDDRAGITDCSKGGLQYVKIRGDSAPLAEKYQMWIFANTKDRATIKRIDIDQPITKLPDNSFRDTYSLTSANLPDLSQVTQIGDSCFQSCYSLREISIPNAETIGDYCFQNCHSLRKFSMPSVSSVGNYVLRSCYSLQEISMPNAETIGDEFAYNPMSLDNVYLPNLQSIGSNAFYACPNLTSADLSSLTTISNDAIGRYCSYLYKLDMPNIDISQSGIFPESNMIK